MIHTPAGQFRTRLALEQPVASRNETGENVQAWSEVAAVWAKVKTLSGTNINLQQADTLASIATHQITIRYNPAYLGQVTWRCRIGATMGFDSLDDDEFAEMTSADFASLVSDSGPPPRYFRIKGLMNTDEQNRELSWLATEVQG